MKNKKDIKTIPVAAISTFGHCGIDWLHSLIDSHKEILIIPPLSFFRKINILKKKGIIIDNSLKPRIITNIITKAILGKNANESYNILSKNQNKSIFIKYINDFLIVEKEFNIEKRLFFAIHYAFAKINKINLDKIKMIVAHEHAPWNCYQYDKYFNSRFIFMVRDPRATIAGSLRGFQRYKDIPTNFPFDINISFAFSAHKFIQSLPKNKFIILKNEEMHKNLKTQMQRLSKWLNIKFNKSLLHSTFSGKRWLGESSYIGKGDLKKKGPKNYYNLINIKKRWRNFLDKNTILIIETVYEKVMIENKYKFDNKLNIASRFLGYIGILFKFNGFKNFFSFLKLGYIKNVFRRIFIVFFPNFSRKNFNLYT